MPVAFGTRARQDLRKEHMEGGGMTRTLTRDPGMSKRVVTSATFTANNGRVTGSNGDFANFAAGDDVLIEGVNANNGYFTVTGIDSVNQAYLVLDPAPKNEGPVANTVIRTP